MFATIRRLSCVFSTVICASVALGSATKANCQDLKIECYGSLSMVSSIGPSNEYKSEIYEFKDGKLYGNTPAIWTKKQITVNYPRQATKLLISNSIAEFDRTIIFDRETGQVYDRTHIWRSDLRNVENLPNQIMTYEAHCRKFTPKF